MKVTSALKIASQTANRGVHAGVTLHKKEKEWYCKADAL
jgi:hypothetical protein